MVTQEQLLALKTQIIAQYGEAYYYSLIGSGKVFKRTYRGDFTGFVFDCFQWKPGKGPTKYQEDITGMIGEGGKTAVQSLHGIGKTALFSWAILWFSLTRDGEDWKAPTTASAWRQLEKYLFPEVHKWARLLDWNKIGRGGFDERTELQKLALQLETGAAFAVASDNPGLIEGAHADALAFFFDEAKLVPAATFDAANGAFSGAGADTGIEALAVAASTPGEPMGRFYDICRKGPGLASWKVRRVRLEEAVAAKRVSNEYVREMLELWGEDSALFQNKVLGEFAAQGTDNVIPIAWVEAANLRYVDYCKVTEEGRVTASIDPDKLPRLRAVGADIADGGGNYSVLAPLYEDSTVQIIANIDAWVAKPKDQINTARKIGALLDSTKLFGGDPPVAVVDANGNGAGVYSWLEDANYEAIGFVASEGTEVMDSSGKLGFRNLRALAYWHLRELLNPERKGGSKVALPPAPELTRDLTSPKWKEVAGAKILLESKEDIAKRQDGQSTDYGDAVTQAFLYQVLERRRALSW